MKKKLFVKFGTASFGVLLISLGTLPSAGQLIPPTIQNLSIMQGSNTHTMRMEIPTQATVNYTAEFRSQFGSGSWSAFTAFAGSGSSQTFSNTAGNVSGRFYRVSVDPRPWIRGEPFSRDPYGGETVQLDV